MNKNVKRVLGAIFLCVVMIAAPAASCMGGESDSDIEPDDYICETDDHKNEPECRDSRWHKTPITVNTKNPAPRKTKK
jgi:hypothetical protein